jgi:hypothetical protein
MQPVVEKPMAGKNSIGVESLSIEVICRAERALIHGIPVGSMD